MSEYTNTVADGAMSAPERGMPESPVLGLFVKGFHMGGMQSILGGIAAAFQDAGFRIVFLTSRGEEFDFYPPPKGCERVVMGHWSDVADRPARRKRMCDALRKYHVKILVHHLFDSPVLEDDILAAKECGAKVVVHFHSSATSLFARSGDIVGDVGRLFAAYRSADALICLSRCDEVFFCMMGVRARYIPNPMPAPPDGFQHRGKVGRSIIWAGRFSKWEKRPQDAIAAFVEVLREMPDATLTMLGDGPNGGELRQMVADDAALSHAVRMPGKVLDVWSELANADVLLLTSAYEGFPGVVAEAYAAGVPVVGYQFENLELCRAAEAYHAVPYGDVRSLAREAVSLLSDTAAWNRAHVAAKAAHAEFASYDLASAYSELVADVLGGNAPAAVAAGAPYDAILRTFFLHACLGRMRYLGVRAKLAGRPKSIRGCLRFILRRIFARLSGGKG